MGWMLTGCSHAEDDIGVKPLSDGEGGLPITVSFDAYTSRQVTRAGTPGVLTTAGDDGTVALTTAGFGVFGYYADNSYYTTDLRPEFMYNEQVTSNGTVWTYEPVKYWPNEYGEAAHSDDIDRLTFFAYAPWVDCTPSSGKVDTDGDATADQWGITGFSRNSAAGDPMVKYITTFDLSKQVDLSWGTVHSDSRDWQTMDGGQTLTTGLPFLDLEHPADISQKMKFNFLHALAALNVQIDVDPDVVSHNSISQLATETKVYVRSISFTGFAQKGALNLNNEYQNVPRWLNYTGQGDVSTSTEAVTVHDGRRNGREGQYAASNEKNCYLNKTIISDDGNSQEGVTHLLKNLFDTSALEAQGMTDDELKEAPVFVIPTGDPLTVTISYDVETEDDKLTAYYLSDGTTHGSRVSNVITKEITFAGSEGLENGRKYTVTLHIGLNSVKFDAAVSAWDEVTPGKSEYLPGNRVNFGLGVGIGDWGGGQTLSGTRAADNLYNTTAGFDGGEEVKVFMENPLLSGEAVYEVAAPKYGVSMLSAAAGETALRIPSAGTTSLWCVYPSASTSAHVVRHDQTTAAGYKASDLMYGQKTVEDEYKMEDHIIPLSHQLVRLKIVLDKSIGVTKLNEMRLLGVKRRVPVTVTASGMTIGTAEAAQAGDDGYSAVDADNNSILVEGEQAWDYAAGSYTYTCLLPPQTLDGDFLYIEANDGMEYTFDVSDKTLTPGSSYTVNVEVSAVTMGTTATITSWTEDTGGSGYAVWQ